MRLAFMGSPEFSVPALVELIAAGHDIAAVYTQPPRPAGRGQKEQKQPVHECAEAHELEVRTPENFKSAEAKEAFADLDLDIAIVIAYGLILPKAILDAPEHGCLNLHASLLPRWRGAAPIQRAIMAGDNITGIQLMQMEKGLDTGPALLSETVPISATDTAGTLHDRLSRIGADMLPRALAALERGGLTATPQSNEGVLYAEKISSAEARIDWSRPAEEVDWHIRGLSPFPGAWFEATDARGKPVRCKALFSAVDPDKQGKPGEILSVTDGICVGCGKGAVRLHQIQRAGKRAQNPEDFLRGFPLSLGDIFL